MGLEETENRTLGSLPAGVPVSARVLKALQGEVRFLAFYDIDAVKPRKTGC